LPWPDAKHPGDSRLLEPAAENAATAGRAQRRAVVPLYRAWILARPALRSRRPKRPAARRASSMTLARVRGTAPYAWSTVSCMVSSVRFGGGMGSRPRRAHSRLGGAAVVTGSGEVAPKLHGLSGPRRITPLSTDKTMPRSAREAGTWGAGSVSAVTWHSDTTVSSSSPRSRAQRREPPLVLAPGGTGKSAGS